MGAVGVLLRATLRSRLASSIVVVLLIGVGGGAVLGAVAGARRTASSYERMLEAADAADVLVNPNDGDTDFDAIRALPQVDDAAMITGAFIVPRLPDGQPDFTEFSYLPVSGDRRFGRAMERPVNLQGRLPDPQRADEVFLSTPAAEELDAEVGDTLEMLDFALPEPAPIDLRVVGVGLFSRDALEDERTPEPLRAPALILSPAWEEDHPFSPEEGFRALLVQVAPGTLDRFLADAQRVVGDDQLFLQTTPESTAKAERALRPYVTALYVFAAIAGFALVVVVGQALSRNLLLDMESAPTLSALGFTRRQQVATVTARAAAIGLAAAAVAGGIAVALSWRTPIGPAADLEPGPGLDVDGLVLVPGLLAIVGAAVLCGLVTGLLAGRPAAVHARRSRTGELVARLGLAPIPSAGIRMALERGRGRAAVPVGTTLVGAALGITTLVAALTFGAGLDHFLSEPRLYGWGWDASVEVDTGDPAEFETAGRQLREVDGVEAVAPAGHAQIRIDGVAVPAVAVGDASTPDGVRPPLLEGRNPRRPDELALGTTTLRRIDHEVGDRVTVAVGARSREVVIVGRSVFPLFAQYPGSDKTGLGVGALLTADGLGQMVPELALTFFLVDITAGADRAAVLAELGRVRPAAAEDDPESFAVMSAPQRPEDVAGYDDVNTTPLALAGLLAVFAIGTTAHGLVTSTRRRRGELALLKTFGCTRRQISAAVAWQATTVGVIALLVGLPLGVAAGRRLWILLADRLGTVPEPVTPVLAVLLTIPITLVVVNLVAAVPGRQAGAIPTAVSLRAE